MVFLPIVERELRTATRRRLPYLVRIGGAAVASLVTGWVLITVTRLTTPESIGASIFHILTNFAFFLALFPGVVLTADCLSQEKRDGTIGLLLLTRLRTYDVVCGKLIGASVNVLYAVLAIVPVLSVPLLLGGVTGGELWRVVVVLLHTVFFSLALGVCVSAYLQEQHITILGTLAALIVVSFLFHVMPAPFSWLSPYTAFRGTGDVIYQNDPMGFVASIFTVHAMIWGLLRAACAGLRKYAAAGCGYTAKEERFSPVQGTRELLDVNPAQWLGHRQIRRFGVWGSLTVAMIIWGLCNLGPSGRWRDPAWVVFGVVCFHAILQFWLAWEATTRLNADRRTGALELLLSTPLLPDNIVRGQIASLEKQFLMPIITVVVADLLLLLGVVTQSGWSGYQIPGFLAVVLALIVVLAVDAIVLPWIGLWMGLKHTRSVSAYGATIVRMVVFPAGLFMLVSFLTLAAGRGGDLLAGGTVVWAMLVAANGFYFSQSSQRYLETEFRLTASDSAALLSAPASVPRSTMPEYYSMVTSH